MNQTPHARYFAHELTKRSSSASIDSLTSSLADAQTDLNPHRVDAILSALNSMLTNGIILADAFLARPEWLEYPYNTETTAPVPILY